MVKSKKPELVVDTGIANKRSPPDTPADTLSTVRVTLFVGTVPDNDVDVVEVVHRLPGIVIVSPTAQPVPVS